jgi:hypothetical protein
VVELHDPTVSRQIGIVTKREVALSPMTDQLRKLIVRQFQRMSRDKG